MKDPTIALEGRATQYPQQARSRIPRWILLLSGFLLIAALHRFAPSASKDVPHAQTVLRRPGEMPNGVCHVPLPPLLTKFPPAKTHPAIQDASKKLEAALSKYFAKGGMDSISVAVATSEGPLYEGFWGARRANETDEVTRGVVDRHTIYRIASISKLFTALETLILRDRGALNLDDSVHRYLPIRYNPDHGAITFRQLMSHMAGIGRDWPPGDASETWPKSLEGSGPPIYNGLPYPTHEEVFASVEQNHMVTAPYALPVYSNTGFSILSLANVAANQVLEGKNAPTTHAELLQRHIFGPLNLNGSSFRATDANVDHVSIPSVGPQEIEQDYQDSTNGSGGQMSSLSDLVKIVQMLLDPSRPESLISPLTLREWLLMMYAYPDGVTELGMLWGTLVMFDSYARPQKLYSKSGELAGYHTIISFAPSTSYGVVVLSTGPNSEAFALTKLILEHVQAAFDEALEDAVHELLVGTWRSSDGRGRVTVIFEDGTLFVSEYMLDGTDVLATYGSVLGSGPQKLAMWPTAENEYKLAIHGPYPGCLLDVGFLDNYGYIKGYSVNLLRVRREERGVVLELPAVGVDLRRG